MSVTPHFVLIGFPGVTRIPEPIAGQVALSTLRGLTFLKDSLNVIHRDIKPSNILLNSKGEIKVCDFSVSGELHKSKAKTYTGTQYYMAPERIRPSESKQYDIRSDMWSLGLTLVELAMGEYPYPREDNVFAMLTHIIKGPTPSKCARASLFIWFLILSTAASFGTNDSASYLLHRVPCTPITHTCGVRVRLPFYCAVCSLHSTPTWQSSVTRSRSCRFLRPSCLSATCGECRAYVPPI